jgi:hypothetical protein
VPSDRGILDLFGSNALPEGFRYQPDFLSLEEEQSLLKHIVPLPFREFEFQGFTGKRRIVSYGWRYDFNGGRLSRTEDIPDFLSVIRARAEHFAEIAPGTLHQVLITEYKPPSVGIRTARSSATASESRFSRSAPSACAAKPVPTGSDAILRQSHARSICCADLRARSGSTAFPVWTASVTRSRSAMSSKELDRDEPHIDLAKTLAANARDADRRAVR